MISSSWASHRISDCSSFRLAALKPNIMRNKNLDKKCSTNSFLPWTRPLEPRSEVIWIGNSAAAIEVLEIQHTHSFNWMLIGYEKLIYPLRISKDINRNRRIMIFKFIDITQIDWKFQTLRIEDLWLFPNESWLMIAFFAARNLGSECKRNHQVAHASLCQGPDSKLNGTSNYFLVIEILIRTPKQILSISKTIR